MNLSTEETPSLTLGIRALFRDAGGIENFDLKPVRLKSEAIRWSRIAANRTKWEDLAGEVTSVQANAAKLLSCFGLRESELRRLAKARIIEVRIPWLGESIGWECRLLPWEFVIINALRPYFNGSATPIIVRCLLRNGADADSALPAVARVVGVVSCAHNSEWRPSYEQELEMVAGYFRGRVAFLPESRATAESLVAALSSATANDSDAIHFLGVDVPGRVPNRSYLWLQDTTTGAKECEYEDAARLLTADGARHPRLVAFSFCHSGPRLAAYTVAHGAHAAIGFQDVVMDDQCQSFFACFYREWQSREWNVLAAFEIALREVAYTLQGTGILLWLDRSLLESLPAERSKEGISLTAQWSKASFSSETPSESSGAVEVAVEAPLLAPGGKGKRASARKARPSKKSATSAEPEAPPPGVPPGGTGDAGGPGGISPTPPPIFPVSVVPSLDPRDFISVRMTARKTINYAVLHNQQVNGPRAARRTLFETFFIQLKPNAPEHFTLDVEVQLYGGDHTGTWRERVTLRLPTTDLAERIHVPLTSVLARSLRESLRTTIETKITVNGQLVDHQCHPVSLLAIEEWLDDGVCHIWLPSFVLPRDPAVSNIVQRARRCLCALVDDYNAGFDGYQWSLPERVDKQVQALWATLSLDWQFGYINPPPSFTLQSQRLRRPSDIIAGNAGTCLDLALLLASCLEFIDVHPVLILAYGHAFVGWWRQEGNRLSYTQDVAGQIADGGGNEQDANEATRVGDGTDRRSTSWTSGKEAHAAIVKLVEEGRLAVIETTGLTRHVSFSEAIREGTKRLRSRLDFQWLIDVKMARDSGITPLPMCL